MADKQLNLKGDKKKEGPKLIRARHYRPRKEYESLDDKSISRIYNYLRKTYWEDIKSIATENQFFTAMAKISTNPKDTPLQNISRKDANKIYSMFHQDIGWIENQSIEPEKRDRYRHLLDEGEFGRLRQIKGIRDYWISVKKIAKNLDIPVMTAREVWKDKKSKKEHWKSKKK